MNGIMFQYVSSLLPAWLIRSELHFQHKLGHIMPLRE